MKLPFVYAAEGCIMLSCRFTTLCLAIMLGVFFTCVRSDAQQASTDNPSGQGTIYVLSDGMVSVVSAATNKVTAVITIKGHKEGTNTYTETGGGSPGDDYRPMFLNSDQSELFVPTFVLNEPAPRVAHLSVISTANNSVINSIPDHYLPQAFSPDWNSAYYTGGGVQGFGISKVSLNEIVNATAGSISQKSDPFARFGFGTFGVLAYVISSDGSKLYFANMDNGFIMDNGYIWVVPTANPNQNPNDPSSPPCPPLLKIPYDPKHSDLKLPPPLQDAYSIIRTPAEILLAPRSWDYIQLPPSVHVGNSLALSPDNSKLYMTGPDGLSIISTVTKSLIATIPNSSQYYGVKVSPDGNKLYVLSQDSDGHNGMLTIISSENAIIANIPIGGFPTNIVVSEKTTSKPEDLPQPGDILVYRAKEKDGSIVIVHSGVIIYGGVLPDGTVNKIESKWGAAGRYIHDPNDTMYGKSWTVWRANRKDGSHSNYLIHQRYSVGPFHTSRYYTDSAINTKDIVINVGDYVAASIMSSSFYNDDLWKTQIYISTRDTKHYPIWEQSGKPTPAYNCHGWTFTNGKVYVAPENAQRIINDDGYYQIKGAKDTDGQKHDNIKCFL